MAQRELFNANTQQVEEAELTVDANNEIVATFADGTFVKFPAGLSKEQFEAALKAHQDANEGKELVTPEMEAAKQAERDASLALIGEDTSGQAAVEAPADEAKAETKVEVKEG